MMSSTDAIPGLARLQQRIHAACQAAGRQPQDVRLVAVTKTESPNCLAQLAAAGVCDMGENRVEHLLEMHAVAPPNLRFHYLGRVQSRQFPAIARHCEVLHSLANIDHIPKLAAACAQAQRRLGVFCQVDCGLETHKAGIDLDDLPKMIERLRQHQEWLDGLGLMTMAPVIKQDHPQHHSQAVRAAFARIRAAAQDHHLPRLSMGMSGDFELAIAEGATDIRIGSAIFRP